MSKTVRVLLDVDGVINGVGNAPRPYSKFTAEGYCIMFNHATRQLLQDLCAMEHVDMVWLTTWCSHDVCVTIGEPLELPPFRTLDASHDSSPWWKWPLAQAEWERDNLPFVWLDDDLRHERDATAWVQSLPQDKVLAISPNTSIGLTRRDHDLIREFVGRYAP